MNKYCSKHPKQKLIQLFSSWACDVCDGKIKEDMSCICTGIKFNLQDNGNGVGVAEIYNIDSNNIEINKLYPQFTIDGYRKLYKFINLKFLYKTPNPSSKFMQVDFIFDIVEEISK